MRLFRLLTILLFSGLCLTVYSQTDSTLQLLPEKLSPDDIEQRVSDIRSYIALSATRTPEKVEDLPFTVWVVTKEDILLNGYVTLVDVLRAAPGIRTSQPGNAVEGETFLMRGLSGNQYVKVLINDVPVKPSAAQGMPIGAQLPIRQAERIEVYYGPASPMYGDEAFAGVVNIILQETERPIFTQADLAFGNMGYNSLDLTFGGKLGKDKNILRFTLYGSSTIRQNADIYHNSDHFKLNRYLPFGLDSNLYVNNLNFRADVDGDSIPKTIPIPHESRMTGVNLDWRGIRFSYHRMARTDFAGLGLNPLSISWSNPSSLISERLESYSLGFNLNKKRIFTSNNISVTRYEIDRNSTAAYIFDHWSANLLRTRLPVIQTPAELNGTLEQIHQRYNSNERHFAGRGLDIRLESILHTNLGRNLSLDMSASAVGGGGAPLTGHLRFPTELDATGVPMVPSVPYSVKQRNRINAHIFGQIDWHAPRIRVMLGSGANFSTLGSPQILPRLGVLYRLDSTWNLVANYSQGIRRPAFYNLINTIAINPVNLSINPNSGQSVLITEKIRSVEGGLRFLGNNLKAEGIAFYNQVDNLSRPNRYWKSPMNDTLFNYGFANDRGRSQQTFGVQSSFRWDTGKIPINSNDQTVGQFRWRNELYVHFFSGKEYILGEETLDEIRNAPRWVTQFRTTIQTRKWHFMMASTRVSSTLSKAISYNDDYERTVYEERLPKYNTWDAMLRIYLSNHFLIYVHVNNVFDRHFAGLDATGTYDDLIQNPQLGRLVRFGVNYNMN